METRNFFFLWRWFLFGGENFSFLAGLCAHRNWIGLIHHARRKRETKKNFHKRKAHRISETLIHYVVELLAEPRKEIEDSLLFHLTILLRCPRCGLYVAKYLNYLKFAWGFSLANFLMCFWSNFKRTDNEIMEKFSEELSSSLFGFKWKEEWVLAPFMIHIAFLNLFPLLYYHFPQTVSPRYILFTFNNNKINIGWMRNELQTSTQAHVLAIFNTHFFREINSRFYQAQRLRFSYLSEISCWDIGDMTLRPCQWFNCLTIYLMEHLFVRKLLLLEGRLIAEANFKKNLPDKLLSMLQQPTSDWPWRETEETKLTEILSIVIAFNYSNLLSGKSLRNLNNLRTEITIIFALAICDSFIGSSRLASFFMASMEAEEDKPLKLWET